MSKTSSAEKGSVDRSSPTRSRASESAAASTRSVMRRSGSTDGSRLVTRGRACARRTGHVVEHAHATQREVDLIGHVDEGEQAASVAHCGRSSVRMRPRPAEST